MIIGITGGTGCGKTSLLRQIEARGGLVLDCDAVYHRLLREDREMLNHFKRLGKLRKDYPALRLGDIQFSEAEDRRLSFSRTYEGKTVHVYVNRSGDPWDIPAGKVIMGYNLQVVAPDWLTLAPRGFCVVEE